MHREWVRVLLVTARTRSQVLGNFERYAFELLSVTGVASGDGPLPQRVVGPSAPDVSERAAPLLATHEARVVGSFVEAHAQDIRRCLRESSRFGQARGRVVVWERPSVPAARAAIAADAPVDVPSAASQASAS